MLIMDRNRTRRRPATAVHVWRTLFVGCRTRAGDCRREFDGRTVELHAASRPCFFSPMEVVAKIGFSRGAKRVVLLAAAPIMFRE
jgi:hypothetical protein